MGVDALRCIAAHEIAQRNKTPNIETLAGVYIKCRYQIVMTVALQQSLEERQHECSNRG